ncbi:MAG: UDP-glucose dehydrogenase family protein [Bacillota bacterium]
MYITVMGSGYVGLVTAACLADFGHFVTSVDKDTEKISKLKNGEIPVYELGLKEIVQRNTREGRLIFTTDLAEGVKKSPVIFIGVGTPPLPDGSADLSQVEAAAREIACHMEDYKVIVNKSTVPVGTGKRVAEIIKNNLRKPVDFDMASNPEFLREGTAIQDFTHPDRVVIGTESDKAREIMQDVYKALYLIETPFVLTNMETAELIKYASNAFLATKITFINEMANLCEAAGADVQVLAKGIGLDGRIGRKFLHAGPGYGGSCFPKDTKALTRIARSFGEKVSIVETVVEANENQKKRMVRKVKRVLGDLSGKTVAILGLAFKQNTDDMREAPSITIINGLLEEGARIKAHDPIAVPEAKKVFGEKVEYCKDAYEAAGKADALVIITDWNMYRRLDFPRLKSVMRNHVLIDLRNIYTPEEALQAGFYYEGVGRGLNFNKMREQAAPAKEWQ